MLEFLMFIIGMTVGFVAGVLVYRNNQKKLEKEIMDWNLNNLSEIRKKLMGEK